MKKRIEIIDHTADVGLRISGGSGRELFEAAAEGMISLMLDRKTVQGSETREIHVEAETEEELLRGWLREVLFVMERDGIVFRDFHIERDNLSKDNVSKYFISAILGGEQQDSHRHGICTEIKAVTRHNFSLSRGRVWNATILFDV